MMNDVTEQTVGMVWTISKREIEKNEPGFLSGVEFTMLHTLKLQHGLNLQKIRWERLDLNKRMIEIGVYGEKACQCGSCNPTPHKSDCAVHNEPALPKGECNCGVF